MSHGFYPGRSQTPTIVRRPGFVRMTYGLADSCVTRDAD
jgi:hypothetical protein